MDPFDAFDLSNRFYFDHSLGRWCCGDVPLHCGDPLDCLQFGQWIPGRFEIGHDNGEKYPYWTNDERGWRLDRTDAPAVRIPPR